MSNFPELLDDNHVQNDNTDTVPSLVLIEKWLFPIVNIISYLLIFIFWGLILSLIIHFAVGLWQFLSCLICWRIKHNKWRNLYQKLLMYTVLSGIAVFGLILYNDSAEAWGMFGLVWLFIFPHGLNWLYWVAVCYDAKRITKPRY